MYPLPPEGVAVTLPLFSPHVVAVPFAVVLIPVDEFTIALAVAVHPFVPVTVTLYVFGVVTVVVAVVAPLLHK